MGKAADVVNLVVSEGNECNYGLAAHTAAGDLSGPTEAPIRGGHARFDAELDVLVRLARDPAEKRGHADASLASDILAAG